MSTRAGELLIIGAGPSGLALSHRYAGPSLILEAGEDVGGLCRSVEFGGGVFDLGGHSFHSPHAEVLDLIAQLMEGRWSAQRRDARVYFDGQLIDYPFQSHFQQLDNAAIVAECSETLPDPCETAGADNFEDWIVARFGAGIARHFMLPYNRKLWARDLRRMSREWVGERIAGSAASGADTEVRRAPLQSQSQVGYPADGGFVEIFRALARRCGPIALRQKVIEIDPAARTARTDAGNVWPWRTLVSTIPLPVLLRAIKGCPLALVADADALEFVSLKILMILVGRRLSDEPQRVYVADPGAPAHKIAFNHTSSESLRRLPTQAIMCEISHSPFKPLAPDGVLTQTTLDWLIETGLVRTRADVAETRIVDLKYGYPVYTHNRPASLARIRAFLGPLGIHTIGRFGAWDYVNSDACLKQGADLAARLSAQN